MDFSNNKLKRNIIIIAFALLVVVFVLVITISIVSSKKNSGNSSNNGIESSSNDESLNDDLKELAEMAYINNSNEEVNSIYNKMINNIVKQHTIKFSLENDYGEQKADLDITNGILRLTGDNEGEIEEDYIVFNDFESITYKSSWNDFMIFKSKEAVEKKSMLQYIFGTLMAYIDFSDCKAKLKEKDDSYIIEFKEEDYGVKLTIDKDDFLLSAIEKKYEDYENDEIKVMYDKEKIELPDKYLNLDKEYVTANDEDDDYFTYSKYINDEKGNLDNISFEVPNIFENTTDDPYEKDYSYFDADKDAYIMFSISTIKTKSIENLKNSLADGLDDVISSEVYSEEINGINWDFVGASSSWRQQDFGIFKYDGKIYLVTYSMDYELEDKDCFSDIIWSIKIKEDEDNSR